jgi:hypothetical protein
MRRTVTELIRFKWQVLLDRVQERTSEPNAQLSGDPGETEEVIQRKHDFEKLHRTMSILITPPKRYQAWHGHPILGMLAVSESVKATQ